MELDREKNLSESLEMYRDMEALAVDIQYLYTIPAFRRVILNAYLEKHLIECVTTSADPSLNSDLRNTSLLMAQAVGHLKYWMDSRILMGKRAATNIKSIQLDLMKDDSEYLSNEENY